MLVSFIVLLDWYTICFVLEGIGRCVKNVDFEKMEDCMLPANRVHDLLRSLHSTPWNTLLGELQARAQTVPSRTPRSTRNESGVVVEFDVPGKKVEDFSVSAKGELLTISCPETTASSDLGICRMRERDSSKLDVTLKLPFAVHADLTEVLYQKGILKIQVKAPSQESPVKIPVVGV